MKPELTIPKVFVCLFVIGVRKERGCNLALKQAEQGIDLGDFEMVELTGFGN